MISSLVYVFKECICHILKTVTELVRLLDFSALYHSIMHITAVAVVVWSPALVTCGTSQVLVADVSGGFPGLLPFRPTYRLK